MYPCRHRSPLLAVAMSLVVALCLKLNNGRFGVANGGRHGEVGTSSHHRSCRDGIQPWQLVPQGHYAAERVTSAFLLSCKERRIQQHKSKRGHRESSWGGPSRTAALSHCEAASSTSAPAYIEVCSCTSQRGRVSRARKALNRCDAQVQGLTCLRFGRGEPWCCISLRHRRKQTSWRALIPKKEKLRVLVQVGV